MARIHDDNPDPAGRGERRAMKRAPISGEVVGRGSRPRGMDEDNNDPSAEDIERFGGETRTCAECKKEVFDDTAVCYHCGHAFMGTTGGAPGKTKRWVVVTVIALVVLFVVFGVSGLF